MPPKNEILFLKIFYIVLMIFFHNLFQHIIIILKKFKWIFSVIRVLNHKISLFSLKRFKNYQQEIIYFLN